LVSNYNSYNHLNNKMMILYLLVVLLTNCGERQAGFKVMKTLNYFPNLELFPACRLPALNFCVSDGKLSVNAFYVVFEEGVRIVVERNKIGYA
jgi:hypothetical protein